jgi:hypothetical protein
MPAGGAQTHYHHFNGFLAHLSGAMGRQHGAKTGTRVLSEDLKFLFRS